MRPKVGQVWVPTSRRETVVGIKVAWVFRVELESYRAEYGGSIEGSCVIRKFKRAKP